MKKILLTLLFCSAYSSKYYELALKKCYKSENFSIHGLWPQYSPTRWPQYCKNVTFNSSEIRPIEKYMDKEWQSCEENNTSFWSHEWEKHGSCMWTKLDELQYFKKTIYLFKNATKSGIITEKCRKENLQCLLPLDLNFHWINNNTVGIIDTKNILTLPTQMNQ